METSDRPPRLRMRQQGLILLKLVCPQLQLFQCQIFCFVIPNIELIHDTVTLTAAKALI